MAIEPFHLERWFARYEHDADIMLAESGVRPLPPDRMDLAPETLGYVIPTNGDPAFRASLAERYGRSADEIVFTCGTQEANFLTCWTLLGKGGHAIAVAPTYQSLVSVPATFGDVTRVWLDPPDWQLDPDDVAAAIRPETELIVFVNPNNPTGRRHGTDTVRALYDLAADANAYLLCDEVYRMLAPDPLPPVASLGPHGLSTAGLSKAYGLAGARFGWLCGDRRVVDRVWEHKDYTTISPSPIGQQLARQALGDRESAILSEHRTLARSHRETVATFLDEHGLDWHTPTGVNGFVRLPSGTDSRDFCRDLVAEESVVLAPGAVFGVEGYVRIGFGCEPSVLSAGLSRLGRFLDRRR